jgi:hypothetical protein
MNLHRRWDSVFAEVRSTELEFQVGAHLADHDSITFSGTSPTTLEGPMARPSLPGVRCEGQLPGPTAAVNSAGVLGPQLVGQSQCQSQVAAAAQCDTPPITLEGPMASPSLPGVRCDDQLPGPTAAVRRVCWARRRLLASLRVSHCHCHWVAAAAQCGPAQGPRRAALLGESPRPGGPKRGSRPGQRALRPADSGALGPRASRA